MGAVAHPSVGRRRPGTVPLDVGLSVDAVDLEAGELVVGVLVVQVDERTNVEIPESVSTASHCEACN